MPDLAWSREAPRESGWYWLKEYSAAAGFVTRIVRVRLSTHVGTSVVSCQPYRVHGDGGHEVEHPTYLGWSGPLQPPGVDAKEAHDAD